MRLRFAVLARRELFRVSGRYEGEAPDLGNRFLDDAARTLSFIKDIPEARRPRPNGVRMWPMTVFPYGLLYAIEADEIVILAVGHLRRGPRYWKSAGARSRA